MRTITLRNLTGKLLASSALVALIAGAPATVDIDPNSGVIAVKPSLALAKGDNSGSGGGGGGGDDGGSDSSGSGSGGDDGGRDNSGPGSSGDDGHDDNSGPGSSDDDDDDDDDNSGPGSKSVNDDSGAKAEIDGDNIEISYPDGTKEEIENGVYERKDATGNTVEERPATQTDVDRLTAGAAALENSARVEREFTGPDGTKVEVTGNDIEVTYSDGWREEIEAGQYEMKDPNGNTVVERPATPADRSRLEGQIPG
jgi:hypothetical protein